MSAALLILYVIVSFLSIATFVLIIKYGIMQNQFCEYTSMLSGMMQGNSKDINILIERMNDIKKYHEKLDVWTAKAHERLDRHYTIGQANTDQISRLITSISRHDERIRVLESKKRK